MSLEQDAGLVCIVGANGTGKSHLLELIAACAHRLGLSPGIEIPRGDPFQDQHDFTLEFSLTAGISEAVDNGLKDDAAYAKWDRTLKIVDENFRGGAHNGIFAGGIEPVEESRRFATQVVERVQRTKEVHFLSLDADRSYPKKNMNVNEVAQAYETDWGGPEFMRGRSFRPSRTLYDEWLKYFLAKENQAGTALIQESRRAAAEGNPPPTFEDHFSEYAGSLLKVLPHLRFTGVNPKRRTLLFDTTGLELSFDQLSGGEREIAFLVGQIDRFGLRQGLFLLDEPELHLNADLIRNWVTYLTSTILTGQIWLSTHSLEAVEAAGQHATFVLERNEKSRKVEKIARLEERPVLSALSRAVGTPAFSISGLKFVFIEGEPGIGERERYRKLAGAPSDIRFIECGPCQEVLRRTSAIRAIASEVGADMRVGGVVDRDFRGCVEVRDLQSQHDVLVLPVLESENLFLHPDTLRLLVDQNGHAGVDILELTRTSADKRAGAWVFQFATATKTAQSLPELSGAAKEFAKSSSWHEIVAGRDAFVAEVSKRSGLTAADGSKWERILLVAVKMYEKRRRKGDFWKLCEGKQVLSDVAKGIGFLGSPSLVSAAFTAWDKNEALVPSEVKMLRKYFEGL